MKTRQEMIQDRDTSILFARQVLAEPYFILDIETTGNKDNYDQMCQIAVLKSNEHKYESLVKPTIPIRDGAFNIHHISNEDVENAPTALEVIEHIPLHMYMVIYNAQFDIRVLINSVRARKGIMPEYDSINTICDAMTLYSAFKGDWNADYNNYRRYKLEIACEQCGIEVNTSLFHGAMYDAIMTEKLLKYIASQKLSTE